MRGNTFGHFFSVSTFGESHGEGLGAVIDGCPSGIELCREDFSPALARRRPGQSEITSNRREPDEVEILSGVFEGRTLGSPVALLVRNHDVQSETYSPTEFRVGHADRVWQDKFGHRDWRGGGRSSGRETVGRVLGGVVAEKVLGNEIQIVSFVRSVGTWMAQEVPEVLSRDRVDAHPTRCPDPGVAEAIREALVTHRSDGNSLGGMIETWVDGIPSGWGEPVFQKLKAHLAAAMLSIGGVVGFELGGGFASAQEDGQTYHAFPAKAGGILGGISNGDRIWFVTAFKPTSTLGEKAKAGRHDPCIVPRAVPVVEAMTALVLADAKLEAKLNRA